MRRVLALTVVGLALAAVLVVTAAFVLARSGPETLRELGRAHLAELLGGEVAMGDAGVRLGRRGIVLAVDALDVAWPESAGSTLRAARVEARLDLWAALRGRVLCRRLRLSGADLELRRGRDGGWLPPTRAGTGGTTSTVVRRLQLEGAAVRLVDADGTLRLSVTDLHLDVERPLLREGVDVDVAGHLGGAAVPLSLPRLALKGRVSSPAEGTYRLGGRLRGEAVDAGVEAELRLDANRGFVEASVRAGPTDLAALRTLLARQSAERRARAGFLGNVENATLRWLELRWQRDAAPAVALRVEGAGARVGQSDRIEGLDLEVHFQGERLELRAANARHEGRPLPRLELGVRGLGAVGGPEDLRCVRPAPVGGLPGHGLLRDLLTDEEPGEAGWSRAELGLDWIEHPMLLCAVEQLQARLEPIANGTRVELHRAVWAGAPIRATASLVAAPEPLVTVEVALGPPFEPSRPDVRSGPWASGRFRVYADRLGPFRTRSVRGRVRALGSELRIEDASVALAPRGLLRGRAAVDLGSGDAAPFELALRSEGDDLGDLAEAVGQPRDHLVGPLVGALVLRGALRAGRPLLEGAAGDVTLHARDGEVRADLPLFVAISSAKGGLRPFAERDVHPYRAMDGTAHIEDGALHVQALHMDGLALRAFLAGDVALAAPHEVDAVTGLFFLRRLDSIIGRMPVLNRVLLGEDENLVGAYFVLTGPLGDLEARMLTQKTVASGPASFVLEGIPAFVRGSLELLGLRSGAEAAARSDASRTGS